MKQNNLKTRISAAKGIQIWQKFCKKPNSRRAVSDRMHPRARHSIPSCLLTFNFWHSIVKATSSSGNSHSHRELLSKNVWAPEDWVQQSYYLMSRSPEKWPGWWRQLQCQQMPAFKSWSVTKLFLKTPHKPAQNNKKLQLLQSCILWFRRNQWKLKFESNILIRSQYRRQKYHAAKLVHCL